jgi:hypothetical protein
MMKQIGFTIIALFLSTVVVVTFQNCSDVAFDTTTKGGGKLTQGQLFNNDYTMNDSVTKTADILFLVDTSGSMVYEHTQIANRFANFIAGLDGIDWRVGISTMLMQPAIQKDNLGINTTTQVKGADGNLIPYLVNNIVFHFLDSRSFTVDESTALFSENIRRPQSCGFGIDNCDDHERGIYTAHRVIDRKDEHLFFRENANLNMVFVSDENENSDANPLEAFDQPQSLIDKVDMDLNVRSFSAHSIVYRPEDSCTQGSKRGTVYIELSEKTGGVVGSVCESDYTEQLTVIADSVVQASEGISLPCTPAENTLVLVFDPLLAVGTTYEVVGRKINFNMPLPDGQKINATGKCL